MFAKTKASSIKNRYPLPIYKIDSENIREKTSVYVQLWTNLMRESPKGKEEIIDSPQEIAELLSLAKDFLWKFSYCKPKAKPDPSNSTEIFHVNLDEGYLTVSSEINAICPEDNNAIQFVAQDAGIRVNFDSKTLPYPGNPLAYRFASERRVAFPEKLIYQQNRENARISFENQQPVSLALFTDKDIHMTGVVSDISATGIKGRFPGYIIEQFEEQGLIADCVLELPNGKSVQCRVEVLGSSYEFTRDVSFVRGRFQKLTEQSKSQILELIEQISKQKLMEKTA